MDVPNYNSISESLWERPRTMCTPCPATSVPKHTRAGNLLPAGLQGWKALGCEDAAGRKTTVLIHPSNVLFSLSYAMEKV